MVDYQNSVNEEFLILLSFHKAIVIELKLELLVPRNIQEGLDDPNLNLAVTEEVNALSKNGDLEEVLMSPPPPPGFEKGVGFGKVCKLKKSLYGLKQSPSAWFERFGRVLRCHGYTQSEADHTMFYKHSKEGKVAILIVHVDHIVLTGGDHGELDELKKRLAQEFEIRGLRTLKYLLGMEFFGSKEGIFINQRKYALYLLQETGPSPLSDGHVLHSEIIDHHGSSAMDLRCPDLSLDSTPGGVGWSNTIGTIGREQRQLFLHHRGFALREVPKFSVLCFLPSGFSFERGIHVLEKFILQMSLWTFIVIKST
uniref:Reverse transcriptase Ty1/copia-type domain-containing protein n=1 Tax=Cannabis sativa TaxID=3483 RepID=A0A803QHQ0_CANSA